MLYMVNHIVKIRSYFLPGIEDIFRIKDFFGFGKKFNDFRAKHFLEIRSANQAIVMLGVE